MTQSTPIEWTDATWNPVRGCARVSAGCMNCYAERVAARFSGQGQPYEGLVTRTTQGPKWNGEVRTYTELLDQPLRWTRPRRIFVNSMSDLFHPDVPFKFIADVFAVMSCTTRHTYQILTKRPARMLAFFEWLATNNVHATRERLLSCWHRRVAEPFLWPDKVDAFRVWPDWTPAKNNRGGYDNCGPIWPLENVWLGVSVENQATADERIPLLLETPAAVRWISAEPLLEPVSIFNPITGDLEHSSGDNYNPGSIDWVVAGGESGPGARPTHPDWIRSLRDQCANAHGGVPFFFKQWGEWAPDNCQGPNHWQHLEKRWARWTANGFTFEDPDKWPDDDNLLFRLGKKNAGRLLDGRTHDEYPA